MNNTTNMICAFLGGVAIGAMAAVGIMKKMGYSKEGEMRSYIEPIEDDDQDSGPSIKDVPSYGEPEKINTQKVQYHHIISKPSLEEMAKKYEDESLNQHLAEREYPEEDGDDSDDEEEDDEESLQQEIAEAMMSHPGQYEDISDEYQEIDGYGHVMMKLASKRADNEIYLVPEEYSGEIYPIEDLRWFAKDDVLVDVTDAVVDDPDRIIGSALEHFDDYTIGGDRVYVRNITNGYEYEIVREPGSYASYLYGVTLSESEIPPRTGSHPSKTRKKKRDEEDT